MMHFCDISLKVAQFYHTMACQCGICCSRMSACLSQVSVRPKQLNIGSHKQRHTIAQGH